MSSLKIFKKKQEAVMHMHHLFLPGERILHHGVNQETALKNQENLLPLLNIKLKLQQFKVQEAHESPKLSL